MTRQGHSGITNVREWNNSRGLQYHGLTSIEAISADFLTIKYTGGGQNVERRNVERLKFRNIKVPKIKITKDELFDGFIIEFIFSLFRNYLNSQNI